MRDAFGISRDEVIRKASSRSEKRESVALGAGALAGVGGATAVEAMNYRDKAKASFAAGKRNMRRATKAYGHAPQTRAHYRGQGRANLARSGHLAAKSKTAGLVAAGLLGGAGAVSAGLDMTRKKEVSKAFTGYGDRAIRAHRGAKQGLRMVGAQKGFDPRKAKTGAFVPAQRSGTIDLRSKVKR